MKARWNYRARLLVALLSLGVAPVAVAPVAVAQNGISDGRVSLPDGPGSIGGVGENVDINANMGAASFRVPLRVPEGANEVMTPQMALVYSSGQGMGTAGIGWDLLTPSIERTTNRGLPTYTTADRFAADGGTELVYVDDLEGSRVYRARFEGDFVRYRWFNAGAAGYWVAEYPDGRLGYYGATADGTLVPSARVQADSGETFRYHLVELVDVDGRRMVQRFTKENGWVLLDEVQYAFGGLDTARFSMRFVYEARPDVMSDASPGYEIQLTQRLSEVRVMSEAAMIRRYALSYESPEASGTMSRLRLVEEFGRDGGRLPIAHQFTYSRSLGGTCEVGCERPFMVDMGTVPGGATVALGRAQLVDINGDSLPDMLVSSDLGEHTFYVSDMSVEGRPTFGDTVVTSAHTTGGSSLILGDNGVQIFDVNGDGFSDVVNQRTGDVLCNDGAGDWSGSDCIANASSLPSLDDDGDSDVDPEGRRFFDYDNDRLIDVLVTASDDAALVYRNTGDTYEAVTVQALGATFDAASNLNLGDLNGDGLLDPARIVPSGTGTILSYRTNIGFGQWLPFEDVVLGDLPSGSADSATLQDVDGDGLDDVVVVSATSVRFWLNRNGGRFDAMREIVSADVDGEIPDRTAETVLFADMNGNGTEDVVWINGSGNLRFLELFPVRPNLLSRIENGIGFVRQIEYGTSSAERARDEGTANEWETPMPSAMNVVTATDTFVTLTGTDDGSGVHERTEFAYHAGYYDGGEKAFRGFEEVERLRVADPDSDGQAPGRALLQYDVGRDDTYRHGLLLRQTDFGGAAGDVPLRETRSTYEDCALAEVTGAALPIRFLCNTATTTIRMEGRPEADWATVRVETDYDGYGNIAERRELGVTTMGSPESPMACGACNGADGTFGGACGASCTGDEQTTTTTYLVPGAATEGRWLLRLADSEVRTGTDGTTSTRRYFYDGPDFVGLASGSATRGRLSRVSQTTTGDATIDEERNAYDERGNLIATLDPNGQPAMMDRHRRDYAYDERGLRIVQTVVRAGDYDLVRDVTYESSFLKASQATAFRVVSGGSDLTARNPSSFRYDEFGRVRSIIRPGDSDGMPTEEFTYELGDPVTRVVVRARRALGGPLNVESVICRDGLDRTVQTRTRLASGRYQVDGFVVRNARGEVIREYQPYASTTGECEMAPPADVRFTATTLDALGRVTEVTEPDADLYGTASTTRTLYQPLASVQFDANDTDDGSLFANTPITTRIDGLDRTVRIERALTATEGADYQVRYDGLGRIAQVIDPAGNARVQEFDLAGRLLRVVDPNSGETTYERDDAGNAIRVTNARGETQETAYDALNRPVMRWDAARMMETLEETVYDYDADCTDCRNGAGRIVRQAYLLPTGEAPGFDAYGYDPRGRRSLLRRSLEGRAFETEYEWDAAGKLVQAVFPSGQTLQYTYDDAQRPLTATVNGEAVVSSAEYANNGRLASFVRGNGVTTTYAYDDLLRVSALRVDGASEAVLDLGVTRDRADNITAVTDGVVTSGNARAGRASHAASYAYDSWYRVTEAQFGDGMGEGETIRAAYDLLDNLVSRTSSLGAASPAHVGDFAYEGSGPNAATQVGDMAYAYDAAGNVERRGSLQLIWDHLGRLIQAHPSEERVSHFAYAPDGTRVLKSERGGVTYYAAPDFVVRDGVASLYVRFGDQRVARMRTEMGATWVGDEDGNGQTTVADAVMSNGDARVRRLRASARRLLHGASDDVVHLHEDLQRSIVATTDASGALVAERAFYAFGAERGSTGFVDEHAFTGQERDETTGLHAFRARYLDTRAGRWMSVDPFFGVLDGSNLSRLGESTTAYAYVANNPINTIDPTGLVGKKIARAARSVRRFARRVDQSRNQIANSLTGSGTLNQNGNRKKNVGNIARLSAKVGNAFGLKSGGTASKVTARVGVEATLGAATALTGGLAAPVILVASVVRAVKTGRAERREAQRTRLNQTGGVRVGGGN